MEKDLENCPADFRPEAEKIVKRVRELYEARFSPVDLTMFVVCDEDIPIHIKRAGVRLSRRWRKIMASYWQPVM